MHDSRGSIPFRRPLIICYAWYILSCSQRKEVLGKEKKNHIFVQNKLESCPWLHVHHNPLTKCQFEICTDVQWFHISNIHSFITFSLIYFKLLPYCYSYFSASIEVNSLQRLNHPFIKVIWVQDKSFKDKDQLWSCDCIVKETLWNRSEKVDHLAYKYWCVLQGSGIIKMIRNLAQSS